MTMQITAKAGNKTCLSFYGPIAEGWSDEDKTFDESKVTKALAAVNPDDDLEILLNSPGGSVDSALAINGILSRHKGGITIHVTGLAASAATLITSLKNAKTVISKGSLMMIHNPMTMAMGNQNDLMKEADVLKKCADSMRALYRDKTGLDDDEIQALMDAETWFTAEEAVEYGFADELDDSEPVTACIKSNHILAIAGREWDLGNLPLPSKEILMSKKDDPKPAVVTAEPTAAVPDVQADVKKVITAESVKAEHPEVFKAIVNDAVQRERERIKALADIDNGANHDMVLKAMFEEPRSAEQVAIDTIKAQKQRVTDAAADVQTDAQALSDNMQDLGVVEGALPADKNAAEREAIVNQVHENLKKINGYN